GTHELVSDGTSFLGKLRRQIVRRLPKRARARLRMTLANEGLKMAGDSDVLVHYKQETGWMKDYDVISVQIPLRVNTSRRMAWGIRPSMIWALPTPPPRASKHACTLGNIPSLIVPFFPIRCTSLRETVERWCPFVPRMPFTSVIITNFSAPSAAAIAPATRSALMLYVF